MKHTVTIIALALAVALLFSACGGNASGKDTPTGSPASSVTDSHADPAGTPVAAPESTPSPKPESTPEPEPEPEKAPEYLAPAKPADPGHFSDADAFLGFDTYKGTYLYNTKKDFSDNEVTLGVTVLKDHYSGEFSWTQQYADEFHERAQYPEKLDAGAVGFVEPNWFSRAGDNPRYIVYNPSDAPAAFEECLMIGFENEMAVNLVFSNDIGLMTANAEGNVTDTDPRDAFIAILGEPYEISGETSEDSLDATYYWRDESGKHVFNARFWGRDGHFQTIGVSYKNFAIIGQ